MDFGSGALVKKKTGEEHFHIKFQNSRKQQQKFPKNVGLKEPYYDVILYLSNQRYHLPPPNKKPLNKI